MFNNVIRSDGNERIYNIYYIILQITIYNMHYAPTFNLGIKDRYDGITVIAFFWKQS